jgi:hypothetical protein
MLCANCGKELEERGCKVRCKNCGYFEDCSDPSAPGEWGTHPIGAEDSARGGAPPGPDKPRGEEL